MFFNRDKDFKLLLEKSEREYKDLEKQYLNLRKEHWELIKKYEEFDIAEEGYKDIIENLVKELSYKTELLSLYHLKFGEECAEMLDKRCKRKNDNSEGIEL